MKATATRTFEAFPVPAPAHYTMIREAVQGWELTNGETIWLALTMIDTALSALSEPAQRHMREAIARAVRAGEGPQ